MILLLAESRLLDTRLVTSSLKGPLHQRGNLQMKMHKQMAPWYTMERPRFNDHLEAIKFICKDFWLELFKKHVDNLRTNHRGTFVLQDNKFCWLARMSIDPLADSGKSPEDITSPTAGNKATHAMKMHLYFPCGILRGFLTNLGILCAVSADILTLPTCAFTIRIKA
ncbi:trafficking protein particle complex subunit 6B-like isoform X3 [Arachis ipaensis]|uniref:trafficking protein particle complex subunit 6B-like isoform X3 n=1 Tax=Arachis ipaensis TaxID=130454 RepID=UPI000A2B01F0|nr:trafficking protein particle complex subunit 6B-like isoform X3 [Arachis ipaensis]